VAGRDVQTNLTIAMATKGFDKGLREMMGVSQKTLNSLKKQSLGYGKVQDKIGDLQKKVQDLAKVQLEAHRAMEKIGDKASEAYKRQAETLGKAKAEAAGLRKEITLLAQAHKSDADAQKKLVDSGRELIKIRKQEQQQGRQQGRWAGAQGLVQGMGMGGMASMFMQRGPGFGRQFVGQQAGGLLRRAGRFGAGMAQTPFGGIQGLQQALTALPGGGMVAGQLGAVAGFSQRALGWQKTRLGAAPYAQPGTTGPGAGQAQAGVQAARTRLAAAEQNQRIFDQSPEARARAKQRLFKAGAARPGPGITTRGGGLVPTFSLGPPSEAAALDADMAAQRKAVARAERAVGASRQASPMGRLGGMGRNLLGVGREETLQRAGGLYQTAGGVYTGGMGQQRGVQAAFAAQTMYGVGADVSGTFLRAGRRGGLAGGRGAGGEALARTLGDAVALGLQGSEIAQYAQQVAAGIQEFQRTGIPFNERSLKSMTSELGKAGIGGVRGAAMAGGLQRYVQGIGQRGIQGGMDLMLMQSFGGFKGGGAQEYEKALLQMESMKGEGIGAQGAEAGTPMGQLAGRLLKMGGGVKGGGITFMRRALGQAGMQMSQSEASLLAEKVTGSKILTPEQRKLATTTTGAEGAAGPQTVGALAAAAAKRINEMGPNLKTQASIMDMQLSVGQKALTAVQRLEVSSTKVNSAFIDMAGPALTSFSKTMVDVTDKLDKFLKAKGSLIGKLYDMTFGT